DLDDLVLIKRSLPESAAIEGKVWNDLNGNGQQDTLFAGSSEPYIVAVVDVSGSTSARFNGTAIGDWNDDGLPDTILDAEIAGLVRLHSQLIETRLGETARVALVAFHSEAALIDLDPVTPGIQPFIT